MRLVAGIHPDRDADEAGEQHGSQRQFERCRQARKNQFAYRHVVDQRAPEIPIKYPAEEGEILPPQRLVETVLRNDGSSDVLCGIRGDQDVDGVAHSVDAAKHEG